MQFKGLSRIFSNTIFQKHQFFMLSFLYSPTLTSIYDYWKVDGEKLETVTDRIFLGSKITTDSDCSHEFKRCMLLSRKAMTNLDSILKRDITLLTKIHIVKAMVFPVVV